MRGRTQTVLVAAYLPIIDHAFLGQRGIELCSNVPVFTASRLDASNSHHNGMSVCLVFTTLIIFTITSHHFTPISASQLCSRLKIRLFHKASYRIYPNHRTDFTDL